MPRNPRPHTVSGRRHLAATAAAATAALVAGCSSPTTSTAVHPGPGTAAPAASATAGTLTAAHGVEAPITAIPWPQVGPGWMLTLSLPAPTIRPGEVAAHGQVIKTTTPTRLYLVSPAGDRYLITTFAPPHNFPGLVGWTTDAGRALLASGVEIDLHTGAQTTIPGLGAPGHAAYADADGTAFLVSTPGVGDEPDMLTRVDRAGTTEVTYPTDHLGGAGRFGGHYLVSPDGTQLVLATSNQGDGPVPRTDNSLVVFSQQGSVVATLPSPTPNAFCSPVKWWQPTVILAECNTVHSMANQLWEVPVDGSAPTALTALNPGRLDDPRLQDPGFGKDVGDRNAWQLPTGTFLQSAGPCGTKFLSRLTPTKHATRVNVPGVSGNVIVIGATSDKLLLTAWGGCGLAPSLLAYDPAANTTTVLLGPPGDGGGVINVQLFPNRP
jgi:TolB protein